VRSILREELESILGSSGLMVLEYQLKKIVGGDPYEVLCKDPKFFYSSLRKIFKDSTDHFLKIIMRDIIQNYELNDISPEKLVSVFKGEEEESLEEIFNRVIERSLKKR